MSEEPINRGVNVCYAFLSRSFDGHCCWMMKKFRDYKMRKWCFLLLALVLTKPAFALSFYADIESSQWSVQKSVLECRLWQSIPNFGDGIFSKRAGYALQFRIEGNKTLLAPGEAVISADAPYWKPAGGSEKIGEAWIVDDVIPLTVNAPFADVMLAKLAEGLMPTVSTPHDLASGYPEVRVGVLPVNFEDAYADYSQCVRELLPVNYRQIERSTIFYASGRTKLMPEVLAQLDLIIRYMKADKRIIRVVIDGHSDATGDKKNNIQVSKRRADLVASYFRKSGISSKKIITRWHGDRYPVLRNDTEEGRARNRRVTIRLDRE